MSFKAIIFDMDGTIIDTESIWHVATDQLLKRKSIVLSQEQTQKLQDNMHGLSTMDCCLYLKLEFRLEQSAQELFVEKNLIAQELFETEVRFIHGFHEFHQFTVKQNLKTAIATNANDFTVAKVDKTLNLSSYFGTHIYNISYVSQGKPDPAIYLFAAKQLTLDPSDCLVIEDSKYGIEAAKRAGMYCIGINTSKKPHLLASADQIVDHYDHIDLKALLEKKS